MPGPRPAGDGLALPNTGSRNSTRDSGPLPGRRAGLTKLTTAARTVAVRRMHMTTLTITVPDELAEELAPYRDSLGESA